MVETVVKVVKHSLLRTFSVICVMAIIALLVLGIKRILYPLRFPTTTQNAEKIEITYIYPNKKVLGIGITLWGFDIGISKYDFPQKPIKQTEVTNATKLD